jgi:hypothetical protein
MTFSLSSSFRRASLGLLSLAIAGLLWAPMAHATGNALSCTNNDTFPCGDFTEYQFTKVPSVFKFQARVSQAKLPIGKGVFSEVIVNVNEGSKTKCIEKFQNVEVRDSVLNLEIGLNMSCEFDELLAKSAGGLALQVCLGSANSCLKPIELASVPYAVKSSFSFRAGEAGTSEEAAVSHYTYRAAADRNLLTNDSLGTGYFDFVSFGGSKNGFLTWTPIATPDTHNLTISGRDPGSAEGTMHQLDELTLDSALTTVNDDLSVNGDQTNTGALNVKSTLGVAGKTTLQVTEVQEALTTLKPVTMKDKLMVDSGNSAAHVLDSTGLTINGDVTTHGSTELGGPLLIDGTLALQQAAYLSDIVTMRPADSQQSGAGVAALQLSEQNGQYVLHLGSSTSNGLGSASSVEVGTPLTATQGIQVLGSEASVFKGDVEFRGKVRFIGGDVDFKSAGNVQEKEGSSVAGGAAGGAGASLGEWSFSGLYLQNNGHALFQASGNGQDVTALGKLHVSGQTHTNGLIVHTSDTSFETPTTFKAQALFQGQVNISAPEDTDVMVALQRKAPGKLQIAPAGVTHLSIESPTVFTGTGTTTLFNGNARIDKVLTVVKTLAAQSDLTVGTAVDGWRLQAGASGLEHTAGENNAYQSVLRVNGGTTVDINPNGATTGFISGTRVFGPLFAKGESTFESGVTVRDQQEDVALFTQSQARFYKEALFDDGATVKVNMSGDVKEALKVSAAGVSLGLSDAGTVTSVTGTFQANGAATFQQGIGGSGLLDVKANTQSCKNEAELCKSGYFSIGALSDGQGGVVNRCCKLELQ